MLGVDIALFEVGEVTESGLASDIPGSSGGNGVTSSVSHAPPVIVGLRRLQIHMARAIPTRTGTPRPTARPTIRPVCRLVCAVCCVLDSSWAISVEVLDVDINPGQSTFVEPVVSTMPDEMPHCPVLLPVNKVGDRVQSVIDLRIDHRCCETETAKSTQFNPSSERNRTYP